MDVKRVESQFQCPFKFLGLSTCWNSGREREKIALMSFFYSSISTAIRCEENLVAFKCDVVAEVLMIVK